MADVDMQFRAEVIDHATKRASNLLQIYSDLRRYYAEQDGLLSKLIIFFFNAD